MITLYHCKGARSTRSLWLLNELGQALFERSKQHVGECDFGGQGDQDVVVARDRGGNVCIRRLDRSTILAPEIQLPGHVEAEPEVPIGRVGAPPDVAWQVGEWLRVLADFDGSGRGPRLLHLRKEGAHCNAEGGPGFVDAKPGDLQGRVLIVGLPDERLEDGVVESPPPLGGLRRTCLDPIVVGTEPFLGNLRPGGLKIGAEREAAGSDQSARGKRDAPQRGSDTHRPGQGVRLMKSSVSRWGYLKGSVVR